MSYDEHLISMAGGDGEPDLDAIQARHDEQATYSWPGLAHQAHADRGALLALVRDQAAKLGRVEAIFDGYPDTPLHRNVLAAITATEASK